MDHWAGTSTSSITIQLSQFENDPSLKTTIRDTDSKIQNGTAKFQSETPTF